MQIPQMATNILPDHDVGEISSKLDSNSGESLEDDIVYKGDYDSRRVAFFHSDKDDFRLVNSAVSLLKLSSNLTLR
jgi:hypothetical protein